MMMDADMENYTHSRAMTAKGSSIRIDGQRYSEVRSAHVGRKKLRIKIYNLPERPTLDYDRVYLIEISSPDGYINRGRWLLIDAEHEIVALKPLATEYFFVTAGSGNAVCVGGVAWE